MILKYLARASVKRDELYGADALASCQVRTGVVASVLCIFLIGLLGSCTNRVRSCCPAVLRC
jgi:hypothetical protein